MRRWQKVSLVFLLVAILALFWEAIVLSKIPERPREADRAGEGNQTNTQKRQSETFWEKTFSDPVATFTGVLVVFTAVLAGVAIIQIRFLRRADETATLSAQAAFKAAEAATLSAQAAISVERAQLELSVVDFTQPYRSLPDWLTEGFIMVKFINHGRTTGHIVERCVVGTTRDALPDVPRYPIANVMDTNIGEICGAGQEYGFMCGRFAKIPRERAKLIAQGNGIFWLYGYVAYKDFLGDYWRTKFCVALYASSVNPRFRDTGLYPSYAGREPYQPSGKRDGDFLT